MGEFLISPDLPQDSVGLHVSFLDACCDIPFYFCCSMRRKSRPQLIGEVVVTKLCQISNREEVISNLRNTILRSLSVCNSAPRTMVESAAVLLQRPRRIRLGGPVFRMCLIGWSRACPMPAIPRASATVTKRYCACPGDTEHAKALLTRTKRSSIYETGCRAILELHAAEGSNERHAP